METKATLSSAVLEVLNEKNYMDWSVRVKTYLMGQDLWDIVEASRQPPRAEDDEAVFKAWSKNNAMALHVIQISCGPDSFSHIRRISSARDAWVTLAAKYTVPQNTNAGSNDNRNNDYVEHRTMCNHLQSGDWRAAREYINHHRDATTAQITISGKRALHVAVAAGHVHIVEKLVQLMSEDDMEKKDKSGLTALHETTFGGNYHMAQCMLRRNRNLVSIGNMRGYIPVVLAITNGHLDLARYLYSLTPLEDLEPEKGINGATLFTQAIYTRALDIALDLIQRCPRLATALDKEKVSPLYALASMPYAFPSGNPLVFWKQWIYSIIQIQPAHSTNEIRLNIRRLAEDQSDEQNIIGSAPSSFIQLVSNLPALLAPSSLHQLVSNLPLLFGFKDLYEMKLAHSRSDELLSRMCETISDLNAQQRKNGCVDKAIFRAIKEGIFEFVFHIVKVNPDLLSSVSAESRNIFSVAVRYRQAKIYSLIYGLDTKNFVTYHRDLVGNNILHMAGKLALSTHLNRIPGAALQMQRELQWFKEVKSIVNPKVQEVLNWDNLTPRELFTENHKDMMKEGERWMKDTATSCTVVGALIVTIMFAAAFTVPGGHDQNTGLPIFLNEKLFMVFIISDALSLFSSSTSVLMFLGILTSRYAEEDFLKFLPTKMIIGLSTLFFSIATMMITFSAGLLLLLRGHSWIFHPVIFLASVPVTLFVLLQFPLLVEMSISTYGSGIFDRKIKIWL